MDEIQYHADNALVAHTGNTKERKVLKIHRGGFPLFPDYSRVGSENQIGGLIGSRRRPDFWLS
jgi:hypothetical protein